MSNPSNKTLADKLIEAAGAGNVLNIRVWNPDDRGVELAVEVTGTLVAPLHGLEGATVNASSGPDNTDAGEDDGYSDEGSVWDVVVEGPSVTAVCYDYDLNVDLTGPILQALRGRTGPVQLSGGMSGDYENSTVSWD